MHALLAAEADEYVARHSPERDPAGRALVARNGAARPRVVPLGPVTVWVSAPRVNDRRVIGGERQRFMSTLLPPNKAPCLGSGFRLASSYARALATGDFSGVLAQLTGAAARFASGEVREALEAERETLLTPDLSDVRFESIVAGAKPLDGDLRSPEAEELLALIGIRPSGGIELISIGLGLTNDPIEWSRLAQVARGRRLDLSNVTDGTGAPGVIEALAAGGLRVVSRESVIPQSGTLRRIDDIEA